MLPKSLLCLCIALLATVNAAGEFGTVDILLRHVENPSGLLSTGDPCSKFAFSGKQCSMKLTATVTMIGDETNTKTFPAAPISTDSNKADIDLATPSFTLNSEFQGFTIDVTLTDTSDGTEQEIDKYTYTFKQSDVGDSPEGYLTFTNIKGGRARSSLTFAYIVNVPTVSTTVAAFTQSIATEPTEVTEPSGVTETTVVTTAFTGSTLSPTTPPPPPASCSDYEIKKTGVRDITVNGDIVPVYCDYGAKNDKVGLTVIQSRGTVAPTEFPSDVDSYIVKIGTSGIGHNFWLGLDNMHNLTKENSFDLVIDLCCKGANISRVFHQNLTIDDKTAFYTIHVDTAHTTGLDWNGFNDVTPDNGAAFISSADTDDDCEITNYYDESFTTLTSTTGAWWFGSCANNLNGPLVTNTDAVTCHADPTTVKSTGIQMRYTSGYIYSPDKVSTNSIMYDRVRMAVYPSGADFNNLPDVKEFCSATAK